MTPEASDGSHIPQTPDTPILGESERKILKLQAYEIIRIRISDGEVLWTRSLEPIFDSLGLPVKTALTTFGADVRYGGYTKMTGSKLGTKSYRKPCHQKKRPRNRNRKPTRILQKNSIMEHHSRRNMQSARTCKYINNTNNTRRTKKRRTTDRARKTNNKNRIWKSYENILRD